MKTKYLVGIIYIIVHAMLLAQAQTFTQLHNFTGSDGAYPNGVILSGSTLYGTTSNGGISNNGTVFRINTNGTGYAVLKNFIGIFTNKLGIYTNSDGVFPSASVTLLSNVLYGATWNGGISGNGTIFSINTNGTAFTVLKDFATFTNDIRSDGAYPAPSLTLSGNTLYGVTWSGGSSDAGTLFKVNTDGTGFNVLKNFSGSDGRSPEGSLMLSDGILYGTTASGGISGQGVVFNINTNGTGFTVLKNFSSLINDFNGHYTNSDGAVPSEGLTLSDSTLYGTTASGGRFGGGTVFKININGTAFSVLKNFSAMSGNHSTNTDGANPASRLTLSGSTLYGTTASGGISGYGALFKINTDGSGFTVLKNLNALVNDGTYPGSSGLTLSDYTLYGTTSSGGTFNKGVIFSLNLAPTIVAHLQNKQLNLQLTGAPNYPYILQSTTNLMTPINWQSILTNPADANGNWSFTVTNLSGSPTGFYRAVWQ